jgi:transposase
MDKSLSGIPVINTNVAGIDIGKSVIYVAVPPNMAKDHVRAFATFTADLNELVAWLKSLHITAVAMESTSIYWVPLYDLLEEEGINVSLINPKNVKMIPGRKTDVLDSQWLMRLLACGLLQASFIPPLEMRPLRELARYRQDLMDRAADCLNRMHKMLSLMNIQLDNVISDISGKTGQAIIKAILSGNRDYKEMAKLADKNCKSTEEEIIRALHGTYKEEHMFILAEEFRMYESINVQIIKTENKIKELLERIPDANVEPLPKSLKRIRKKTDYNRSPYCFDLRALLYKKFGYDLTVYSGIDSSTAATIIFETGGKVDAFPTHKHFASWLGVCPGNKVSGGKRLSGRAPKKFNRAGQALRIAANANYHADSAMGGYLRRLMRRGKSKKVARKATANKLSLMIYNTIKFGHKYVEKGVEEYEKKYEEKRAKGYIKFLQEMGYDCSTIIKKAV